jgi:hypothetical protein
MFDIRDDLIVQLDDIDQTMLMEFWRWLLPEPLRPWFATALGDLFLRDPSGQVVWLDMGSAELPPVARDEDHFRDLLRNPENAGLWFGKSLVDSLRASGLVLRPGEVYSYQTLPILGGEYTPENFRVYDVVTHFRVWGPIHEKLKDVPDGASVQFVPA